MVMKILPNQLKSFEVERARSNREDKLGYKNKIRPQIVRKSKISWQMM